MTQERREMRCCCPWRLWCACSHLAGYCGLWMESVCESGPLSGDRWKRPHDPWSHIHSTKWRDMTSLLFSGQSVIDYAPLMLPCQWQAGSRGKWKDVRSGPPGGKISGIWFDISSQDNLLLRTPTHRPLPRSPQAGHTLSHGPTLTKDQGPGR